jgi:hypothetical protein
VLSIGNISCLSIGIRAGLLLGSPAQFHRGAQGQPRVAVLHDDLIDLSTIPFNIQMLSDRLNLSAENIMLTSDFKDKHEA